MKMAEESQRRQYDILIRGLGTDMHLLDMIVTNIS